MAKQIVFLLTLLFIGISSTTTSAQSKGFSIWLAGGTSKVNLHGLDGYYEELSATPYLHYNFRNGPRMILSMSLEYEISLHHALLFELDYVSLRPRSDVVFDIPVQTYLEIPDVEYRIRTFPVTLGYRYTLKLISFSPFVGVGISYIPASVDKLPNYTSDALREKAKHRFIEHAYSANLSFGLMKSLSKRCDIQTRLTYRYSSQLQLQEEDFDLSGFYLLLGLGYNL